MMMIRALFIGVDPAGIVAAPRANAAEFAMSSSAFAGNTPIPAGSSCNGRDAPPPLRWGNVPVGTLALVVDDPDVVGGLYTHWVVTGIPPSTCEIVDGALPAGAQVSANCGGTAAYLGPCPPAGSGVHHCRFQLSALNKSLASAPTTPADKPPKPLPAPRSPRLARSASSAAEASDMHSVAHRSGGQLPICAYT